MGGGGYNTAVIKCPMMRRCPLIGVPIEEGFTVLFISLCNCDMMHVRGVISSLQQYVYCYEWFI